MSLGGLRAPSLMRDNGITKSGVHGARSTKAEEVEAVLEVESKAVGYALHLETRQMSVGRSDTSQMLILSGSKKHSEIEERFHKNPNTARGVESWFQLSMGQSNAE